MKYAIITFHNSINEHEIGGITTGCIYFRDRMKSLGMDFDIFAVGSRSKNSGFKDDVEYVSSKDIKDRLNAEYNFVVFNALGITYEKFNENELGHHYDYILDGLKVPYGVIVNEENDRKIYPYWSEFTSNPQCKLILFNSQDMHLDFPDLLTTCKDYIEFNLYPVLDSIDNIIEKSRHKKNVVMSTAKWGSTRKRLHEFAKLSPKLVDHGYEVRIAGAAQTYFQVQKILNTNPTYWTRVGYYTPDMVSDILKDCRFHYNFVYLKKFSKDRKCLRPRIELATFEAINNGCIPLICADSTPEWSKCMIRLSSKDYDSIPDELDKYADQSVREDTLRNIYTALEEHLLPMYDVLINKIHTYEK